LFFVSSFYNSSPPCFRTFHSFLFVIFFNNEGNSEEISALGKDFNKLITPEDPVFYYFLCKNGLKWRKFSFTVGSFGVD